LQALSAVLGGTQSLHTNGFDEALSLPTEDAAQVALRTQQIIAFESGAADTADPLAGSFYVESLTASMESMIREIMQEIEQMGGSVKAIEEGYMQEQIALSAYRYQNDIEEEKKIIVGLNRFTGGTENDIPVMRIDDQIRIVQCDRLKALRSKRDATKAQICLEQIEHAAKGEQNLMPLVIEAVEHYCTLGEIAGVLRSVFGEHRQ
jgi:methylmalonyl-CoA mutase N-terminal domain/subunit